MSAPPDLPPHRDPDRWDELIECLEPEAILVAISSWMGERLQQHCAAEDIWQETLAMAWRDRDAHEWQGVRGYRAWLCGIARNRVRDTVERISAKKRGGGRYTVQFSALIDSAEGSVSGLLPARSTTPSRVAFHGERARLMQRALAALPDDLAEVVRLSLFEELPMPRVAERLAIGLSTAKRRFFVGAGLYRRELEKVLGSQVPREGADR